MSAKIPSAETIGKLKRRDGHRHYSEKRVDGQVPPGRRESCAIGDVGSKIRTFFLLVAKMVIAKKRTKNPSFAEDYRDARNSSWRTHELPSQFCVPIDQHRQGGATFGDFAGHERQNSLTVSSNIVWISEHSRGVPDSEKRNRRIEFKTMRAILH